MRMATHPGSAANAVIDSVAGRLVSQRGTMAFVESASDYVPSQNHETSGI